MKGYDRHDEVLNTQQLLLSIIDLANQRGAHPDKLLKGTKIFYNDLTKVNVNKKPLSCSANTLLTVIENCSKLIKGNEISFLLGRRYFPSQLGLLGQAFMNCRHLADMLRLCQCFQLDCFPLMNLTIKNFNGKSYLLFQSAVGKLSHNQQIFITEFMLSALLGAIKYRCGELPELYIYLDYPQVEHIEQYHTHLNMSNHKTIKFEQQICMVTIDSQKLYLPFNDSAKSLKLLALQQLRQDAQLNNQQYPISFTQQLIRYINQCIATKVDVSQESCAQHFGYSSATLKRKLASHALNYQGVIDNIRSQQAIFQLIICHDSNEKIADALYFTDVSNFRKAFKRWTGMTPNSMRERLLIALN
ncbi:AraC family transcriptional regulator [Colwellia sp. E2M01]|uniref:AraC family transcriptional regulator n=1 Tax=Colwellia sp. E2M01 TaxID=2841561 RepID=UPI001C0A4125|nr:AraC family transcriptional regulator [Colwellia sp. E2M01]MBU2870059.1 AraC family transcriptional regulator [Colwellia sp. E2M01]